MKGAGTSSQIEKVSLHRCSDPFCISEASRSLTTLLTQDDFLSTCVREINRLIAIAEAATAEKIPGKEGLQENPITKHNFVFLVGLHMIPKQKSNPWCNRWDLDIAGTCYSLLLEDETQPPAWACTVSRTSHCEGRVLSDDGCAMSRCTPLELIACIFLPLVIHSHVNVTYRGMTTLVRYILQAQDNCDEEILTCPALFHDWDTWRPIIPLSPLVAPYLHGSQSSMGSFIDAGNLALECTDDEQSSPRR